MGEDTQRGGSTGSLDSIYTQGSRECERWGKGKGWSNVKIPIRVEGEVIWRSCNHSVERRVVWANRVSLSTETRI